jgi:WD40 repeat protein
MGGKQKGDGLMKLTTVAFPAALVAATFLLGCSPRPSAPGAATPTGLGPKGEGPSSALPSIDAKERFSLDTGVKGHDGKPEGMTGIAVSADGKVALAMGTARAGNVQVWDLENRKKLYQYDSDCGSVLPVAISPDSKLGAYFSQQLDSIVLIDLSNGKEVRRLRKKGDVPLSFFTTGLAFSPKGDLVIVGYKDEIIGWDPTTGDEQFVLKEAAEVTALTGFFGEGKKIAAGTEKGTIKVWDTSTGNVVQTLVGGGKDKIAHLVVSGDGKRLGGWALLGPIKIWDLTSGKLEKELPGDTGLFPSMWFLPDNRTVVYITSWELVLQDIATGKKKTFGASKFWHYPVAVTPDGSTLLSSEEKSATIRVWDLKSAR